MLWPMLGAAKRPDTRLNINGGYVEKKKTIFSLHMVVLSLPSASQPSTSAPKGAFLRTSSLHAPFRAWAQRGWRALRGGPWHGSVQLCTHVVGSLTTPTQSSSLARGDESTFKFGPCADR